MKKVVIILLISCSFLLVTQNVSAKNTLRDLRNELQSLINQKNANAQAQARTKDQIAQENTNIANANAAVEQAKNDIEIAKEKINEDKQLGPYFISKNIVVPTDGDEIDRDAFIRTFKNKVIMYLFEDAARQKRSKLFEGCSQNSSRYSEICREFDEKGIGIFNHDIQLEAEPEEMQSLATETE